MSTNAPRQPNKNEKKLSELYPKHAPTPAPPKFQEKTRTIVQNYFITSDGREFLDKDVAVHHQNLLDGTSIVCPNCNGKGEVDWCGDGMMVTCSHCNGKGYLVRTWGADK